MYLPLSSDFRRNMSEDPTSSSGDEGALQIDTDRKSSSDKGSKMAKPKGKGRVKVGDSRGPTKNGRPEPPHSSCLKPGDVVWAKVTGFKFWPAKIFDAENDLVPAWLKSPPKPTYMLVRFFGTYDMQWVSPSSVESYDKGLSKRFHSKSRSKSFQKAVKEVFAYVKDSVIPEGLTLRPPDPPSGEEDGAPAGSRDQVVSNNDPALSNGPATDSANSRGSSRRKSSTPRRRLSSSSSDSLVKRPRLGSADGRDVALSPEVQAFTCAPLPLAPLSTQPQIEN